MNLLSVNNLSIAFYTRDGKTQAVDNISFNLKQGETLGIVGESGSGKSVSCHALMGLINTPPGQIEQGTALFNNIDLLSANEKTMRSIRGKRISMIFQDPMTALNPYLSIGAQIIEPLLLHEDISPSLAKQKALTLLEEVGINDAASRYHQYPHEFSGGMRQRVVIAMALITEPELLIADEPTTALDVTIQAQILELIKDLQRQRNIAVIFISHDLDVIRYIADRTLVMEQGHIVEQGQSQKVFNSPSHPYTKKLLASIPQQAKPAKFQYKPKKNSTLLAVNNVSISYADRHSRFQAVNNVSLKLAKGEVLGLVGESGCGKTTLSQSIVKLINIDHGDIQLGEQSLHQLNTSELKLARKKVQMIFQDPYASLNPRMTVFNTLAEPLKVHRLAATKEIRKKVLSLMTDVGLDPSWANKYPHEFSGGQRQRIAIARALAVEPQLIIADEPVSALDVTIQAQILELLLILCQQRQLTMIFISHDLAVVRYIADRTAVMSQGKIVELNETETLYRQPAHSYTQQLLSAKLSSQSSYQSND
ncbi:MAG: ABC transporter ATP-binding protein [Cellvibrionales bacterium]|nr:ABC transporter ATP-binding protein [Cellvibrionales bacterium]